MTYTVTLVTERVKKPVVSRGLVKSQLRTWIDSWLKDDKAVSIFIEIEKEEQ